MQATRVKPTMAWPLVIFLLLPALGRAETQVVAWYKRFGSPAQGSDGANAMAVDSSNNVIVTGLFNDRSYGTIKYSKAGVPLWTNYWNDLTNQLAVAACIAVDGSNNVIVTGNSSTGTSMYANDYATIKYSSTGVPLWTNRFNGNDGPGYHYNCVKGVAVDSSNNVVVTGFSTPNGSRYDYATVEYSSAGVPLWTNFYNGSANTDDQPCAVAVDGSNNVIVTGHAAGSGSALDYATIQYSGAGVPLWTNIYNGPAGMSDFAEAVAVDGSNNVIVTGYSAGNGSGYDCATIKYSSVGVPLWTNRYNGPANSGDYGGKVATDRDGNVIVTGHSEGGASGDDYATMKYSSDGVPLWTNRYSRLPGYSSDQPRALAVDSRGNAIVTGMTANGYTTIKYSSAGVPLWTNEWQASMPTSVVVDGNDNVIVTGLSASTPPDFLTVKYASPAPPVMTALQLTNGAFQLRVDEVLLDCTVVIEASTNLTGWTPVFTNTKPTNVLFYTDPDAGNLPTRFYRAFQFP